MGPYYHPLALRAQTIVARTYAYDAVCAWGRLRFLNSWLMISVIRKGPAAGRKATAALTLVRDDPWPVRWEDYR